MHHSTDKSLMILLNRWSFQDNTLTLSMVTGTCAIRYSSPTCVQILVREPANHVLTAQLLSYEAAGLAGALADAKTLVQCAGATIGLWQNPGPCDTKCFLSLLVTRNTNIHRTV